jgi:hypothetical protein
MSNDTPTLEVIGERLIEVTKAFGEHEKEHKAMASQLFWFIISGMSFVIGIGIWVGTISNEVQHMSIDLQDKVSREELTASVSAINTKVDLALDLLREIRQSK